MFYVGVDGCKKGWWLAVKLTDSNEWEVNRYQNISEVWEEYKDANLILIDIPIGLPHRARNVRSCDMEARKWLGKRWHSVFLAPCRHAVYSDNYKRASEINKEETGSFLTTQAWGIVPRIKEVDQLLRNDKTARARIREIHPEVCFWALNGKRPMEYPKKEKDQKGIQERKGVLISVYPDSEAIFKCAKQKYLRKEVARDDILDALVAAVTAYKGRRGLNSIPEKPELDAHDLPMEMVYFLSAK